MEETGIKEIRRIGFKNPEFPEKLKNYPDMPEELYVRGELPDSGKPSIAIVGARMCSAYGRIQAFRYAKELSCAGIQVISGLAAGIDSEGHKGALEGAVPTFAVLGNGADICYPLSNRSLYERIIREEGGILSEYPPGTRPRNYFFPARNRIISALADVVLVVEAKERSGSLITARFAMEQGKAVYALPGPVTEKLSLGCHQLIYDGAGIAYSPEILLLEWGITRVNKMKTKEKNNLGLARDSKLVYSCLDLRPKSLDEIIRQTDLPSAAVSNILLELQLLDLICEIGRHHYVRLS